MQFANLFNRSTAIMFRCNGCNRCKSDQGSKTNENHALIIKISMKVELIVVPTIIYSTVVYEVDIVGSHFFEALNDSLQA